MAEATTPDRAHLDVPLTARRERTRHEVLRASTLAGLAAGAAMLAFIAACAALAGLPLTRPLALVAALFTGDPAEAGAGAMLGALLVWVVTSVLLALLLGTIVPRDFTFMSAAMIGVCYAFVVMAVVTSSVLPRWNPAMRDAMPETGGAWVLAYAVYGTVLGLLPRLRRARAR
jgi:hypothetical protein